MILKRILAWFGMTVGLTCWSLNSVARASEQAVIVHFLYKSDNLMPLFTLEEQLIAAVKTADVGEYDGHEIATNYRDGYLYLYGPDADRLFETIVPILKAQNFMLGARITKRYGPPADRSRETVIQLTEEN
ncbi:MAG: hypothetical protein P4L79_03405 [Legionella sp.]|uniref:hypothetical protein n=1 Tax=Legionella sp. TaxID=459 RepID=UPI00284291A7|nr:hypothetical protein [Legionella sp.]